MSWLLLAILLWAGAFILLQRPAVIFSEVQGLYTPDAGGDQPVLWTSSSVAIPIHPASGPTQVELVLAAGRWPDRRIPQLRIATATTTLFQGDAPDQIRHYQLLLAPSVELITLHADLDNPPGRDERWLGIQFFAVTAKTTGVPVQAALRALFVALAGLALTLLFRIRTRLSERILLLLTLLAFGLRMVLIERAPPGLDQDEAVSMVDAWYLLHTGHDYLGNPPPLGAQEAFGDWISPLLTYLELPSVALLGMQPLAGRLVTALLGALVVPAIYALARSLRLPSSAVLAAALVCAISPWQIYLSRYAIPPALVPLSWTLCLLAAIQFVEHGSLRRGLWLAFAAGIALYAYPTMKMAVPLLVGIAVLLVLAHHGWQRWRAWVLPAGVLATLWLPFVWNTFFNAVQGRRLNQIFLRADTPLAWLAKWWAAYSIYFRPAFWYVTGDGRETGGVPNWGLQLAVEAPFVLLGLALLLWLATKTIWAHRPPHTLATTTMQDVPSWWLLVGAVLIAPFPASLTIPAPNSARAALLAPLYALLVGMGVALVWSLFARVQQQNLRWGIKLIAASSLTIALLWQAGTWWQNYIWNYPPTVARAWRFQDVALETMQRTAAYVPSFDQIWIDPLSMREPFIYLLAAEAVPAEELPAQLTVVRSPTALNRVTRLDRYYFRSLNDVPKDLPVIEVIFNQFGTIEVVFQEWYKDNLRVLVVRGAGK